ncbi:hypothetical protein ICN28_03095 [Polynucleobacter sp. 30F-ANTBAC]|uniref:hypothetical protein n=1 Tax=Polynucleobacter sp. 30F-ANTBAC TaxID=2689095 RepID=UPI001C0B5F91|nr:hypothetical protein [Polynucleobacter sp. 30F-ANTBAC]MBU3599499.1 hypothetical protein [Polynucleobacter sp. 30F-ANTBAC]
MSENQQVRDFETRGIEFSLSNKSDKENVMIEMLSYLKLHQLGSAVKITELNQETSALISFSLKEEYRNKWAPNWDTTRLYERLSLKGYKVINDLNKEILVGMLLAPIPFQFPSYDEFHSAIQIRHHTVLAGYLAALNFDTNATERPEKYWHYDEDDGFLLNKGQSIIEALISATQPQEEDKAYAFSCYRATEYVILLAISRKLKKVNPLLLKRLEERSEKRAIRSGEFHELFLKEYGSLEDPLPMKYYVPGDRVWFRNPDSRSSDISGYEGSWVIYLGHNLFTNFWKRDQPFTLESKCVEVYHWKDGAYLDQNGELLMNENIVESCVAQSLADPKEVQRILQRMMRYRDPKGVYDQGGCIDTSRESPRFVCPGTSDIKIPD